MRAPGNNKFCWPDSMPHLNIGSPLASPTLSGAALTTQVKRWLVILSSAVCLVVIFQVIFHGHSRPEHNSVSASTVQNFVFPPTQASVPHYTTSQFKLQKPRLDFPNKIWQTWKVDPLNFEQKDLDRARSWTEKNPDWRYEVLTDGNDVRYVEWHYGPEGFARDDIVTFYRDLKAAIIKADLLRYLIMYAEGGVYADIDVEAMKPMSKFIPERYDHKDIDMVIGIEIDEPEWKDHPILGPKSRSFCQWTFMSKPEQPVMLRLVENIMGWLTNLARNQSVPIGEVELDFDEVISGTGPSAFTNAIIAQMNEDRLVSDDETGQRTPEISWDAFHDMDESKVVGRVLVLNVEAFAAGQGHSNSGTHDTRHSLVRHHYHASNWPSRHPRYRHPAYGQVEDCNWNKECVHEWDENVRVFQTLPEDEQKRIIAEKEKEREEKEAEEARKKEEEEAKHREEEEANKKKEEEERIRHEEEEKKKGGEGGGVPPPGGPEGGHHGGAPAEEGDVPLDLPPPSPAAEAFGKFFGYSVILVLVAIAVVKSGCMERHRQPRYMYSSESKV